MGTWPKGTCESDRLVSQFTVCLCYDSLCIVCKALGLVGLKSDGGRKGGGGMLLFALHRLRNLHHSVADFDMSGILIIVLVENGPLKLKAE
jgi:hypothetical protein